MVKNLDKYIKLKNNQSYRSEIKMGFIDELKAMPIPKESRFNDLSLLSSTVNQLGKEYQQAIYAIIIHTSKTTIPPYRGKVMGGNSVLFTISEIPESLKNCIINFLEYILQK